MIFGDKNAVCKLCLGQGPLCESHIVPEFCYGYDEKHRALHVDLPPNGAVHERTIQQGYREYLLCNGCEEHINDKYEKPFLKFLREHIIDKGPFRDGDNISLGGLDCNALKACLLSIFWRCSASQKFGGTVRLGPYAEKLRRIVLNNRRIPKGHYPFFATLVLDERGSPFFGRVSSPEVNRVAQAHSYCMIFGGFEWRALITDHWAIPGVRGSHRFFMEDGGVRIVAKQYSNIAPLRMAIESIRQAGGDLSNPQSAIRIPQL
jgi:hypothetical protein